MPDGADVLRLLLTGPLCVECIVLKTGLTLDETLDVITIIVTAVNASQKSGQCPACDKRLRVVVSIPLNSN
jgi:hypothetical protein